MSCSSRVRPAGSSSSNATARSITSRARLADLPADVAVRALDAEERDRVRRHGLRRRHRQPIGDRRRRRDRRHARAGDPRSRGVGRRAACRAGRDDQRAEAPDGRGQPHQPGEDRDQRERAQDPPAGEEREHRLPRTGDQSPSERVRAGRVAEPVEEARGPAGPPRRTGSPSRTPIAMNATIGTPTSMQEARSRSTPRPARPRYARPPRRRAARTGRAGARGGRTRRSWPARSRMPADRGQLPTFTSKLRADRTVRRPWRWARCRGRSAMRCRRPRAPSPRSVTWPFSETTLSVTVPGHRDVAVERDHLTVDVTVDRRVAVEDDGVAHGGPRGTSSAPVRTTNGSSGIAPELGERGGGGHEHRADRHRHREHAIAGRSSRTSLVLRRRPCGRLTRLAPARA